MSKFFPVSRWLVVDDSCDDAEDIELAIEGLGGKVDIADNIKAAEKLLKKNIYDICIIDCFYKGSTKCGIDLLPELRSTLPGLPVIMMSSSDDVELPARVIRAGADVFCPKLKDSFCLTKMIGSAALQAIAIRKLKVLEYSPQALCSEMFISKQTSDVLEYSCRRKDERLLICGLSGTGKTKVAQYFADQFLKKNYGSISRNIVYHDCALHSEEVTTQLFFGSNEIDFLKSQSTLQLTLFERAVGGVLILDNIHALSPEIQKRLKGVFDADCVSSVYGESTFALNLIKCVATCSTFDSVSLVPGFLESFAHREVDLPSLADLGDELRNVVDFILQHFLSSQSEITITYQIDVVDRIIDLTKTYQFSSNFRTLRQLIENAFRRALLDGRSQIYSSDIEILGSMRPIHVNASSKGNQLKASVEALSGRFGEALLRYILAGENFDQAKDMLRKIMIQNASKKHLGNKSKVAAALGISRQSLYDHEFQ